MISLMLDHTWFSFIGCSLHLRSNEGRGKASAYCNSLCMHSPSTLSPSVLRFVAKFRELAADLPTDKGSSARPGSYLSNKTEVQNRTQSDLAWNDYSSPKPTTPVADSYSVASRRYSIAHPFFWEHLSIYFPNDRINRCGNDSSAMRNSPLYTVTSDCPCVHVCDT